MISLNKKSKNPRKKETNSEMSTTITLKITVWRRVGHDTCLSSACVSCKYVSNDMVIKLYYYAHRFCIKKPREGFLNVLTIYYRRSKN